MSATAGALNFTLGLQANQFLNTLNVSSGKLLGFLGLTTGISEAFNKMWGSIQKGGKLSDLAAAANISVKELYQLQRAFEEVGASAEAVPAIVNRMRRTLGSGEQSGLLAQMGLDPQKLGGLEPGAQFEAVAAALGKLNVNARSAAAQNIFGREGAAAAMQIANSGNDFADAMKRAESDAAVWQRVAKTFDSISDKVNSLIAHIDTMWAKLTGGFVAAFKEGHLLETIFDLFSLVFQAVGAALPNLLQGGLVKIGQTLMEVLTTPLVYLQSVLDASVQGWMALLSKIPAVRDALGIPANFQPDSWDTIVANNKKNGLDFFGANTTDMAQYSNEQLRLAAEAAQPFLDQIGTTLDALINKLPQDKKPNQIGETVAFQASKTTRPDVTALEKIGLVIGGRGNSTAEFARQTADATRQTVAELKLVNKNLLNGAKVDYTNIE